MPPKRNKKKSQASATQLTDPNELEVILIEKPALLSPKLDELPLD